MIRVHHGNFLYTLNSIRQSLFAYLESELARHGISGIAPSHGDILHILDKKGTLHLRDLTELSLKDKSTITAVISHLEKNGYVTRARDSKDKRLVNIQVTKKAAEVKPALEKISEKMNAQLFEGLSGEEKNTLFKLMTRISHNVDNL
ncbi:MAG: MarR family transcriptional regulator [Dehalococcoidia bacterium]|nr:MarR family transcriptional regulator [Dehalococcoidia bacterium]